MTGPVIRPYKDEDAEALFKAAQEDQHSIIQPTHVVHRDSVIIGSLSMFSTPMVLLWMHTQKARGIDSYCVSNFIDNMSFHAGFKSICTPCNTKSPLRPFMDRVGYQCFGNFDLMAKAI